MIHQNNPDSNIILPMISEYSCISLPHPTNEHIQDEQTIKDFIN